MNDFEALLASALRKLESNQGRGRRTRIEDLVGESGADAGPERSRLARELIKADMSLSGSAQASAAVLESDATVVTRIQSVEEYLADFAGTTFDDDSILDLVEHEYRLRIAAGDVPDVDEPAHRFEWLGAPLVERIARLRQNLLIESSIRALLHGADDLDRLQRRGGNPDALDLPGHQPDGPAESDVVESLAERLGRIPPFCDVTQVARDAISEKLIVHDFRKGDVLLRQGEAAESLLIVLDGAVEVLLDSVDGRHSIARLGQDTVVGEIGMMTRELRGANVVAVTAGRAATFAREDFEQVAGRHPRLSVVLSELIAERVGVLHVDVLCGKSIGGYRIRHRLGRGGMGIVYSAIDVATGEPAALKMLRHDLTFDRLASLRFQQEAEIIRDLRHPNIVRVLREFSAFGTAFIAMELCDGPSLSDLVKQSGPLPPSVVRPLIGQIATGLACAHAAGIAHRDLKPSNVMLSSCGRARLVDFGLARSATVQPVELTAFGQIMGTPRYMSPEQLNGERGDSRSDVFSLGCIVYELLAGRPLFEATSWPQLLRDRADWSPSTLDAMRATVDDAMFSFLIASLAEDPVQRPADLSPVSAWAADVNCAPVTEFTTETALASSSGEETVHTRR